MKPTRRLQSFCLSPLCPANRDGKPPRRATHGWFQARSGRRRRRIRKLCGATASATAGTPCHRMHRPKVDLDRALRRSAQGMTVSAIARILGTSPSTVSRWLDKAGRHARISAEQDEAIARERLGGLLACRLRAA